MPRFAVLIALLATTVPSGRAAAQDIQMLGERYGTPVPAAFDGLRSWDPDAFRFRRAGFGGRALMDDRRSFEGGGGGAALTLRPRTEPVEGTFEVPVILGLYSNSGSPPPFDRGTIEEAYFGAVPGTITDYYREVSNGKVELLGDVREWARTARADTIYTLGISGVFFTASNPHPPLGAGGPGNLVWDLLELQSGVDWGRYDNDGADGVPNSGDDDGFVDVVAVIHPTFGGECGGSGSDDRMWSHRWALSSAMGVSYVTSTPSNSSSSDFIRVDDYTIQPSIACPQSPNAGGLSEIGVFTHELGHAFGLPDLYDTDSRNGNHSGAGIWDLMASGTWGCNNDAPASPCHLGAWSKAMLGWVDPITLAPDTDHGLLTLPPVASTGTVFRVDANDGSGEYFLLENRQTLAAVQFDRNLLREGLLVWQIDPDWTFDRWEANRVNASAHMGVWLRQADGRDDLGQGFGRGDAGDPFPGQSSNTAFHAVSTPQAISFEGTVTGVTLTDIQESGDDIRLRVATRFATVTVTADGVTTSDGLFTVNGSAGSGTPVTVSSAPFIAHTIEAAPGEVVAPGERRPFMAWTDDPSVLRERTVVTPIVDTTLVAAYGGRELELDLVATGGVNAVEPATFESDPPSSDLWFPEGVAVTLTAVPRTGFSFLGWSGALQGQGNPASFTLTQPLAAGADFELVYRVEETTVAAPAATPLEIQLEVVNGSYPVTWRLVAGELPLGLALSRAGLVTGEALDTGQVPLELEAVDAIGLPATGVVTLDLRAPEIAIEQLAAPFLLTGPPLSDAQINFLNRQGNGVAPYDIGDFRAWVLANPTLPLSADVRDGVFRRSVIVGVSGSEGDAVRGQGR